MISKSYNLFFLFILLILFQNISYSQSYDLKRRGKWDAQLSYIRNGYGVNVTKIESNGAASKAGLNEEDVIVKINGVSLSDNVVFGKVDRSLRSGVPVQLTVLRGGSLLEKEITLTPFPFEQVDGIDIDYGSFVSDEGYRIQTIISKPAGVNKKMPAIFYVSWLACSNVESRGLEHGFTRVVWELSKAGYLVMRVEKPGIGDSGGPDCGELDFETELSVYKKAYKEFLSLDLVDTNNVFVYGVNMGGVIAPLLVSEFGKAKGIIVNGTIIRNWFEHILDQDRRVLNYLDTPVDEMNKTMSLYAEFNTLYLINKMTPEEIFKQKPYLREVWSGPMNQQFTRPLKYYHQLNDVNIPGAWSRINIPTLVVYNDYDWVISELDHKSIAEMVNKNNPGFATYVNVPRTDHSQFYHPEPETKKQSVVTASKEISSQSYKVIIDWLKLQK